MAKQKIIKPYKLQVIPRAREVKQTWSSTLLSTAKAIFASIPVVFDDRPDLLLLNGPGTCIPIVIASFCLQLFTNHDVKLGMCVSVFLALTWLSSLCRVILQGWKALDDWNAALSDCRRILCTVASTSSKIPSRHLPGSFLTTYLPSLLSSSSPVTFTASIVQ